MKPIVVPRSTWSKSNAISFITVMSLMLLVVMPGILLYASRGRPDMKGLTIFTLAFFALMEIGLLMLSALLFTCMEISPDGIRILLFGRQIGWIPREEIRVILCGGFTYGRSESEYERHTKSYLISTYSMEELVEMQEAYIRKHSLTETRLEIQKQNPDWQKNFAMRCLIRLATKGRQSLLPNMKIRRIPEKPEVTELLPLYFPEVVFLKADTAHTSQMYSVEQNNLMSRFRAEKNTLALSVDGIHLVEGEKDVFFLPASQVQTVVFEAPYKDFTQVYIIVSNVPAQELAKRQEPETDAQRLSNLSQISARDGVLAAMYLRKHTDKKSRSPEAFTMRYSPKRWQMCRTLYPDATIVEDYLFLKEV